MQRPAPGCGEGCVDGETCSTGGRGRCRARSETGLGLVYAGAAAPAPVRRNVLLAEPEGFARRTCAPGQRPLILATKKAATISEPMTISPSQK